MSTVTFQGLPGNGDILALVVLISMINGLVVGRSAVGTNPPKLLTSPARLDTSMLYRSSVFNVALNTCGFPKLSPDIVRYVE